ncbi:MAG TPA: hypothetical protein VMY87_10345 [Armatimonadota bacterium]|nr:hypothetical protein [Armatimonadota bacterium]
MAASHTVASGSITLGGVERPWSSPTIGDLEEFEREVGSLMDVALINSSKGRSYLAWLCLRTADPQITLETVRAIPAVDYLLLWPMIEQGIPLWNVPPAKDTRRPPVPEREPRTSSREPSSDSAASDTTGPPA